MKSSHAAGKGGTGDTWAFQNTQTGEQVAIKFIKRPLPKVLVQNITREFTVRQHI
jgi:serine/threonine protein kinase